MKCVADTYVLVDTNDKIYKEYMCRLVLTVKDSNELLTIEDRCWACYWLMKVNRLQKEELAILKQWFNELNVEQKEQLPGNLHTCLTNIKID